jgi:hypothetical protein
MPIVASLPISETTVSFTFPSLYIKNSIGRVVLSKDRLLFGKGFDLPTTVDGRKECLGVKLDEFLGCCNECHNWPLSRVPSAQKATSYDEGRINAQEGREQG